MNLHFYKYQGTGNDFILLDNRSAGVSLNREQIALLCDRRFGIGADGLMLLELEKGYDFRMVYYNADGNESTMCGNGGRCIAAFAKKLGVTQNDVSFIAIDGAHRATIEADGQVWLGMSDVAGIETHDDHHILDTGSPHYVLWQEDVQHTDVSGLGRSIRNRPEYQPRGINVNFAQRLEDGLRVRTYERGVEDETLSCGTGVTAAAIASSGLNTGNFDVAVQTPGGRLRVRFQKDTAESAAEVTLIGPAAFVFEGDIRI